MTGTIRVKGLREMIAVFDKLESTVAQEIRDELINVAEPVAAAARARISRYSGASVVSIGPRASTRGAFVTQRARKVTGRRGDFGALQQRHLEEALVEQEDEIRAGLEGALDRLTREAGF